MLKATLTKYTKYLLLLIYIVEKNVASNSEYRAIKKS